MMRMGRVVVVVAVVLSAACGGPQPPPFKPVADVKQLMSAIDENAEDPTEEHVGKRLDETQRGGGRDRMSEVEYEER